MYDYSHKAHPGAGDRSGMVGLFVFYFFCYTSLVTDPGDRSGVVGLFFSSLRVWRPIRYGWLFFSLPFAMTIVW